MAGVVQIRGSATRLWFVAAVVAAVVAALIGGRCFRGSFRETGSSGMRSPKLDLQNVPENLWLKPPNSKHLCEKLQ